MKITPLKQNINLCDEIELSYNENSFAFEFSALHYTSPEDIKYAYKLEGFDKDWIQTDAKRRFANYTNIDAGTYHFMVRATNSDGVWKEKPTIIKIVIKPPIWKTWWFRICTALIIMLLIYLFFKYRLNRIERQKRQLEHLVEVRTQEITQKNQILEQQKEEIQAQRDELEQRNTEVTQQKEEIEAQRDELEEKNVKIEMQNEFVRGSIRYAKNIQTATLPPKKLIDSHFESFIIYRPKDVVSGDFYWFTEISEELRVKNEELKNSSEANLSTLHSSLFFLAVVDCTGHGVPGAFMSMLGIRLLNEIIIERRILTPADILYALEKDVMASLRQNETHNEDGMDLCLCRLQETNDNTVKLMYASAKRPLFHYSKNENALQLIDATHRSIGGFREYYTPTIFKNVEMELSHGDILVLSSDGFQDQPNRERKRIGSKRFFSWLAENVDKSMNDIKLALEENLDKHKMETDQRDDITVVGIKV